MRFPRALAATAWLITSLLATRAPGAEWHVRSLPAPSPGSRPLLVQADGDAAPEWGVQDGLQITVGDIAHDYPPVVFRLPSETALFDLRDTDRDGRAELGILRAGRLEYWRDAQRATEEPPTSSIENSEFAPLSYGAARPYPLFIEDRGEDFISVPLGAEPPTWTLEAVPVTPIPEPDARALSLTQFHTWQVSSPAPGARTTGLRISQLYEAPLAKLSHTQPAPRTVGTRRARDAAQASPEDWPELPLTESTRVRFALAPPDFRDSLVLLERTDAAPTARSPRRFPGILIVPPADGPDFNGDGFTDLLFWRAPRPTTSFDALVRAAQNGAWEVSLTVHLYEPAAGRFAPRPVEWFRAKAPLGVVLEGSVRGPFAYLLLEDLDGDGRTDLVCTGSGDELLAWRFQGHREAAPWLASRFSETVENIAMTARAAPFGWIGVVRSTGALHLVTLPRQ